MNKETGIHFPFPYFLNHFIMLHLETSTPSLFLSILFTSEEEWPFPYSLTASLITPGAKRILRKPSSGVNFLLQLEHFLICFLL